MYDPENPPVEGIPADPLPDDLPEGDPSEVVEDEDAFEPTFENFEADGSYLLAPLEPDPEADNE